jgi:adenosylmethionine-8-amino-7-oxononanoate aminotransferase
MVYQYWFNKGVSKKRFLAIEGAYHGDTFGAMSVGQRGNFNQPFEHLFFDVDFIPFPTSENENDVLKSIDALFPNG